MDSATGSGAIAARIAVHARTAARRGSVRRSSKDSLVRSSTHSRTSR
jgi:hypothetical protein